MSRSIILAPAIALAEDEASLTAAGEIAVKLKARAVALILGMTLGSEYADKAHPLSEVLTDLVAGNQSVAATRRQELLTWLRRSHDFEIRDVSVEEGLNEDQAVAHARLSDLVVVARGPDHKAARRALIADILFKSGRPLLLTPQAASTRRWERFVIGWNASANAVRAIAGALPMLQLASQVVIATVDAQPNSAITGSAPGQDLAAYLAEHGVAAEVRNLDGLGRTPGRALCDLAMDTGADALVIGAYGHSRAQEWVFGGVTRELLEAASIPILLAH